MSVKITYFVHGTTTDNEKGLSTGHNHGELSKLGIKQSKELAQIIKNKKFGTVFCSDLKRAVDSTGLAFPNISFIKDKRLREVDYGDLNGFPETDVSYEDHVDSKFPNGESMEDVEKRMSTFLNDLKKDHDKKRVAIVAHKAPQLALEVLLNKKTWQDAIATDWRQTKSWQPGWEYVVD